MTISHLSDYTTLFHEIDEGRHSYHLATYKMGQTEPVGRVTLYHRTGESTPTRIVQIQSFSSTVASMEVLRSRRLVKNSSSLRMGLNYIEREHPENGVPLGLTLFAHVDPRAYAKYLEDTE